MFAEFLPFLLVFPILPSGVGLTMQVYGDFLIFNITIMPSLIGFVNC